MKQMLWINTESLAKVANWSFFKLMCLPKTDFFYMAMAVLSVWKEDIPKDYFSVFVFDENENLLLANFDRTDTDTEVILKVFGNDMLFENAQIYTTKTPSKEFVEASKIKEVEKIVYIPTERIDFPVTGIQLIPFVFTFGKIIDILSQYKPCII